MPTDQETFEAMVSTVQRFYPKYKVISKESSWLHRFIGKLFKGLGINKTYMTDYWTTIGSTVAYPKESTPGEHYRNWAVNVHEGNHAGQANRWSSFLFGSLYLLGTPVYAVLGVLLSIPLFIVGGLVEAVPLWTATLPIFLGILLSVPVPFAWWRYRFEVTAYGASVAVRYWCKGADSVHDGHLDAQVRQFTGPDYFFMMPFSSVVKKKLKKARQLALDKKFITNWEPKYAEYYAACYQTLKDQGRVKV